MSAEILKKLAPGEVRILLVDDELVVRNVLRGMLQGKGYTQVDDADSGERALSALCEQEYHLVFLDQTLPGKSGMDVLREGRKARPQAEFIMLTAYGSLDAAIQAMEAGACGTLVKPLPEIRLVLEQTQRALDRVEASCQIDALFDLLEQILKPLDWADGQLSRQERLGRVLDVVGKLRKLFQTVHRRHAG